MPRTDDRRSVGGFTLIEMVVVIVLSSIVALVTSSMVYGAMRVYTRRMPAMYASYQAHLAIERLRRDVRDLGSTASITVFTPDQFTFDDSAGNRIVYRYGGGDLTRNGAFLARGLTAFGYWRGDGTIAPTPAELHLVDVDLTVRSADQEQRRFAAVFPRVLSP